MRTIRLTWRTCYLLLLGSVALVPACSDGPSEPRPPAASTKKAPIAAYEVSYQNGSELTVVDQSGLTLTVDVVAREVRYNDGRVILLSAEQTAQVSSDFYNTIVYDQLANETQTLSGGPVLCGGEIACNEPMSKALPLMVLTSSQPPRKRMGTVGGRIPQPRAPHTTKPRKVGKGVTVPGPIFDWIFLPDCQSLKSSIFVAVAAYRNERASVIARYKDIVPSAFSVELGRMVLHAEAPAGAALIAGVLADIGNKQVSQTQLDIMRVLFTSQGCGTISWAGSSQGSSSLGALDLKCHDETWRISFDYGETWRYVTAKICEYGAT